MCLRTPRDGWARIFGAGINQPASDSRPVGGQPPFLQSHFLRCTRLGCRCRRPRRLISGRLSRRFGDWWPMPTTRPYQFDSVKPWGKVPSAKSAAARPLTVFRTSPRGREPELIVTTLCGPNLGGAGQVNDTLREFVGVLGLTKRQPSPRLKCAQYCFWLLCFRQVGSGSERLGFKSAIDSTGS